MDEALEFANLFIESNASQLLYFVLAVSLSLAALLIAIDQRYRSQYERTAARYMAALVGVVMAWGILTIGNLFSLLSDSASADTIMPPLERAIMTIVILLIGWAFLVAESPKLERGSTLGMVVLVLVTIGAYGYTVTQWTELADTDQFNQTTLGIAWAVIPLAFLIGAVVLLTTHYNYAADIPLKLLFFGINMIGFIYALVQMSQENLTGNIVGLVRITTLAALAVVPIVVYRMVIERFRETFGEVAGFTSDVGGLQPLMMPPSVNPATPAQPTPAPHAAASRESIWLLKVLGEMLETDNPHQLPTQIAQSVAKTLNVDVVALAITQKADWVDLVGGYNSIQQRYFGGLSINLDMQPTLASAVELNMQSVLLPTRSSEEINDLFLRLDVRDTGPSGPAYFQPLTRNRKVIGMLILAQPYTARLLEDQERNQLEALAPIAARLLSLSLIPPEQLAAAGVAANADSAVRQEMQSIVESAQAQVKDLSAEVTTLREELSAEREKLRALAEANQSDMSITQQISTLSVERERLTEEREGLVRALQSANTLLASATADTDTDVYRHTADSLQKEHQELSAEKERLAKELTDLRATRPADTERLSDVVNTLMAEKERIEEEHNRLKSELEDAQKHLSDLGLEEGFTGYAQLLAHLTEERNRFLAEAKRMRAENDKLQKERTQYAEQYQQQDTRTLQIKSLETEMSRLAGDREALIAQRNVLKTERDTLSKQMEDWLDIRTRLTEQYDALRRENQKLKHMLSQPRPDTLPEATTNGDDVSQPLLSNTGIMRLQDQVNEVEEERSDLEFAMRRAQEDITLLEEEVQRLQAVIRSQAPNTANEQHTAETVIGLAEEFRTPLTSIIGYTELLLGESMGLLGETQKSFLTRIQVKVEQLTHLIENLVRVLAIDYGKLLLAPRKVDVQDIIDDAITASSAHYREKSVTLNIEIGTELPPITGDPDALNQTISRLLGNAFLASPREAAVTILVDYFPQYGDPPSEVIKFAITDQGEGVPQADYERVFNRHYRADNPLIQGLGDKGAGLSIARALVEAHGGQIWLESQAQVGTTFHFYIPVNHAFGEKEIMRGNVSRLIDVFGERETQSE